MPNTDPPVDSAAVALEVLSLGEGAMCQVAVAGAITVGRAGERLAPMGELASLGVRLFTDDGAGVQDVSVMRRAFEYARGFDVTLAQHCEDDALARGGHMHEGEWSSRLGVPGIPAEAEELMVARDIALVRLTGGRVHFLHISTARSAALVAAAKAEGLAVTAEVTPAPPVADPRRAGRLRPGVQGEPAAAHGGRRRARCAPPARGASVDAIATDHAPHAPERKDATLDAAPPGMLGLQTALAGRARRPRRPPGRELDAMAPSGDDAHGSGDRVMSVRDVLGLLSWRPARIAGLARDQGGDQGGPIEPGAPANICVIDPDATWEVDPPRLASRSRNTPWAGRVMTGQVRHTVFRGEPVVVDAVAQR